MDQQTAIHDPVTPSLLRPPCALRPAHRLLIAGTVRINPCTGTYDEGEQQALCKPSYPLIPMLMPRQGANNLLAVQYRTVLVFVLVRRSSKPNE